MQTVVIDDLIEGAQMVKIDGTYYLTFATAGTQYDTYAIGAYKSTESPLSGFVAQDVPVSRNTVGQVCGCGHGHVMLQDPNGNLWVFYVQGVTVDEVILPKIRLPISRGKRKDFLNALAQYEGGGF